MNALDVRGRTSPVGRLLDSRTWAHQTRTFAALGFDFAVRTSDGALGAYLDDVFESLAVDGPAEHVYSIVEREHHPRARFSVFLDGQRLESIVSAQQTLQYLVWHVNQSAVRSPELLTVHASAVARDDRAAVFVAAMESGKSTIAAGLVRAGLDYVTDEAVAFDSQGVVVPYPRPVTLETGSWPLFPELRPAPAPDVVRYLGKQWLVPVRALRPEAVATAHARAAVIVKLRYDATAATTVAPVRRSMMIQHLIAQSFNFRDLGRAALHRMAAIVAGARCIELTMNDLDKACAVVAGLLDEIATTP